MPRVKIVEKENEVQETPTIPPTVVVDTTAPKVVKRKKDPVKGIMKMIDKNMCDIEDLSSDGKVLKALSDAYKTKNTPKKTDTKKTETKRTPRFEKGSEEAKEYMRKIRSSKNSETIKK